MTMAFVSSVSHCIAYSLMLEFKFCYGLVTAKIPLHLNSQLFEQMYVMEHYCIVIELAGYYCHDFFQTSSVSFTVERFSYLNLIF